MLPDAPDLVTIDDPAAFILANTRLQAVPHAPEITLWLADEITPIWKLTEEELGELGLPPPFWAFAWAGGQGLARWMLDHPETFAGRSILDFAAGSGLVGIAARKAGADRALCADIDPFCGAAVALNAQANAVALTFTDCDLLEAAPPQVDLICAGDVCYEAPMTARVMDWLRQARRQGSRVLIGDPHRTYFKSDGLTLLAEYQVPTTRELEDFAIKRSSVFELD